MLILARDEHTIQFKNEETNIECHTLADMPLFRLRPEFPAAGACMTDSFRFEHFIILKIFFLFY